MGESAQNVSQLQTQSGPSNVRQKKQRLRTKLGNDTIEDRGSELAGGHDFRPGCDFSQTPLHSPAPAAIQTKLALNQPGNASEQEANRVAELVTNGQAAAGISNGPPAIERLSYPSNSAGASIPVSVYETLARPGVPLESSLRMDMGQRFHRSFSDVRVHSDSSAAQSAQDLNARAYTVASNVVFGPGSFTPETGDGRRLIAHELTHVVQQSQRRCPGLVQCDPKEDAKKAARAKVVAAMEKLKSKYGFKEVSEENGMTWTEAELKRIDASFAKLGDDEKEALKGLYIVRTDKLSVKHKGKDVKVDAITINGVMIKFTGAGTRGNAPVHEVGHVIQSKVLREAEQRLHGTQAGFELSLAKAHLDAAITKAPKRFFGASDMEGQYVSAFNASLEHLAQAAGDLLNSELKDIKAKREALEAAEIETDGTRVSMETIKDNAAVTAFLQIHDLWKAYVATAMNWAAEKEQALGPREQLTEFVGIVKKNNLVRHSFRPFTSYVQSFWPDKPEEFFAESFATFRNDPDYMKTAARPLYNWFQKQGHLEPRPPKKRTGPTLREDFSKKRQDVDSKRKELLQKAPVLDELINEVEQRFIPAIEEALDIGTTLTGG
jgi:hypothetical protein